MPLLLTAHRQGYQELCNLDSFPQSPAPGVPRHVTCQHGSRAVSAPSILTRRGGDQKTLGPCYRSTRAPATWVNKGLRRGCSNYRHCLLWPKSGQEPESPSILRLASPARTLGPRPRPSADLQFLRSPRREPPDSARFYPSGPSGIPFAAFPLDPDLGDRRLPSSWRRFCAVGPSWLPAASSSAPGE